MGPEGTGASTGSPRILIIDDEEVIRELLADFLTSHGYEVALAHSGEDGVKASREKPFEIVLVDYGLPGIHGIDVCRRIAAYNASSRLILMTGWGSMEAAERESCINQVIAKPFDLLEILKTLRALAPVPERPA